MKNARDLACTPAVLQLEQDLNRMWQNIRKTKAASVKPVDHDGHALAIGDRVIVLATGWDGLIEGIDADGRIYVDMDNSPLQGTQDFKGCELEWWMSY